MNNGQKLEYWIPDYDYSEDDAYKTTWQRSSIDDEIERHSVPEFEATKK